MVNQVVCIFVNKKGCLVVVFFEWILVGLVGQDECGCYFLIFVGEDVESVCGSWVVYYFQVDFVGQVGCYYCCWWEYLCVFGVQYYQCWI